jgi:hypothetical protein
MKPYSLSIGSAIAMKTEFGNLFTVFNVVFMLSLSSLTIAAQPADAPAPDMATENAAIQRAHEGLAEYYEGLAANMQAKLAEQEALLEHYEDKSYQYGRRALDLQSHTHALIRNYKKSVETNLQAAASHRQVASRFKETYTATLMRAPGVVGGL